MMQRRFKQNARVTRGCSPVGWSHAELAGVGDGLPQPGPGRSRPAMVREGRPMVGKDRAGETDEGRGCPDLRASLQLARISGSLSRRPGAVPRPSPEIRVANAAAELLPRRHASGPQRRPNRYRQGARRRKSDHGSHKSHRSDHGSHKSSHGSSNGGSNSPCGC
jgi:hypothetical protein